MVNFFFLVARRTSFYTIKKIKILIKIKIIKKDGNTFTQADREVQKCIKIQVTYNLNHEVLQYIPNN